MSDTICYVDLDFDADTDTESQFDQYLTSGLDTDSLFKEPLLPFRPCKETANINPNEVKDVTEKRRLKIGPIGFEWVKKLIRAATNLERLLAGFRGLDKTIIRRLRVRHYRVFSFCK
jgi:hypothetical protein